MQKSKNLVTLKYSKVKMQECRNEGKQKCKKVDVGKQTSKKVLMQESRKVEKKKSKLVE